MAKRAVKKKIEVQTVPTEDLLGLLGETTVPVVEEEVVPKAKVTPFTWLDTITQNKQDLMATEKEKSYPAFMVNRGLSYYPDCLMFAVEINLFQDLDYRLQYDYLRHSIPSRRRFSKWAKRGSEPDVELIMEHYNYSRDKAVLALKVLKPEQVEEIRQLHTVGIE